VAQLYAVHLSSVNVLLVIFQLLVVQFPMLSFTMLAFNCCCSPFCCCSSSTCSFHAVRLLSAQFAAAHYPVYSFSSSQCSIFRHSFSSAFRSVFFFKLLFFKRFVILDSETSDFTFLPLSLYCCSSLRFKLLTSPMLFTFHAVHFYANYLPTGVKPSPTFLLITFLQFTIFSA
jgi:hypothetical protein